jgi:hypothetical protein|tara:strand:+ start:1875 stop:2354 length:480 start_codon:yes stop_codon:yes gene_type:complete
MKKLIYTLLAVSILFASCKEEDEIITSVAPSIVGVWTPTSISVISSYEVVEMGKIVDSGDSSYTMTPTDEGWGFPAAIEFTTTGTVITTNEDGELETDSYTTSGSSLTFTNSDDDDEDTYTYTVTTTDLVLTQSVTEIETEDGQTWTSSNKLTINCTRQ